MKRFISKLIQALSTDAAFDHHITKNADTLIIGNNKYPLTSFDQILPLGVGKAAAYQTQALVNTLKSLSGIKHLLLPGLVLTKDDHQIDSDDFECYTSSHPLLDYRALENTQRLISRLSALTEKTLIILCLSGGASALLELPFSFFRLDQIQDMNKYLLRSGATIEEINSIRQIISQVKNGGLAFFTPAKKIEVLAVSDVSSNDLRFIGSGPFYRAPLDTDRIKFCANQFLSREQSNLIIEWINSEEYKRISNDMTQKIRQKEISHTILLDWTKLLTCAEALIHDINPRAQVIKASVPIEGDFSLGLNWHIEEMSNAKNHYPHFALMSGGELPVPVHGAGLGGRNTHFVLALAIEIFEKNILNLSKSELDKITILSFATDGSDGPTIGAGAYINAQKWQRAVEQNLCPTDFLSRSDSFSFFQKIDALLVSGPTGNNVMDLRVIVWDIPLC